MGPHFHGRSFHSVLISPASQQIALVLLTVLTKQAKLKKPLSAHAGALAIATWSFAMQLPVVVNFGAR